MFAKAGYEKITKFAPLNSSPSPPPPPDRNYLSADYENVEQQSLLCRRNTLDCSSVQL